MKWHISSLNFLSCFTVLNEFLWLDFRVTFEEAEYIHQRNAESTLKLLLQYPDRYSNIMFPINVSIAEVNDTATGESQSV